VLAWSVTCLPISALGFFLTRWFLGRNEPLGFLLFIFFLIGLLVGGLGCLVGVGLSLLAPRRARLGGWIGTCVAGLVVGVILLIVALFWRDVPAGMLAFSWKAGTRVLTLTSVAALLVSHLGYCCYQAGIANRYGARGLSGIFVALFCCVALQVVLIAGAESVAVYWGQGRLPVVGFDWRLALFLYTGGVLVVLGVAWSVLLWQLRRCLPCEASSVEPDED
jgi:hypothetical protein